MLHSPVSTVPHRRATIIAGGGEDALTILRKMHSRANDTIAFASEPSPKLAELARTGAIRLIRRAPAAADLVGAAEVHAASGDPAEDARVLNLARAAGARRLSAPTSSAKSRDGSAVGNLAMPVHVPFYHL